MLLYDFAYNLVCNSKPRTLRKPDSGDENLSRQRESNQRMFGRGYRMRTTLRQKLGEKGDAENRRRSHEVEQLRAVGRRFAGYHIVRTPFFQCTNNFESEIKKAVGCLIWIIGEIVVELELIFFQEILLIDLHDKHS